MKKISTNSTSYISLLSELLFRGEGRTSDCIAEHVSALSRQDLGQLWELATTHHVILRAFPALQRAMIEAGRAEADCDWVETAMAAERRRVDYALSVLAPICKALERVGNTIVIKSLDHIPDLGSDLDLFSTGATFDVVSIMRDHFSARTEKMSWGDRMANKWNFVVPGLPELIEVHIGRLGQMGEQVFVADSLVVRAEEKQIGAHAFRVPRPEDRLIISTLQRMYRHFYLRLCDVADTACLIRSGAIDYDYLESLSRAAGVWDGLCSYLKIVAEYVETYGGQKLGLPNEVIRSARFGGGSVTFRKFLRIPIFPHAVRLYAKEWAHLLGNGEFQNTFRLSLMPGLAMVAALVLKIRGSDKGIW